MKIYFNENKMVKVLVLFCFVLLSIQINAQATVYVNPSSVVLAGQSEVTVDFMISNVDSLHAYNVIFHFDSSIIKFKKIDEGPFLSAGMYSTLFLPFPQTVVDSLNVAAAILGPHIVSGSGKLFSVTFNVASAGTSQIEIVTVKLAGLGASVLPVSWNSGQIIVPLSVNLKTFLQGPFNGTNMNTTLNSSNHLPFKQPYHNSPWNYNEPESVPLDFFESHSNIVDWILVELRTGIGSTTMVERKAGFITNNGTIVSLNGVSLLYFNKPKGNYYLVIYHRNHLSIMSSSSAYLNYISAQYDFTNALSKAYGVNAMINLGGSVYGMCAGDADANGQIQNSDIEQIWSVQNGQSGYLQSDFNLNGQVQNNDNETFWAPNNGKGSQVPN